MFIRQNAFFTRGTTANPMKTTELSYFEQMFIKPSVLCYLKDMLKSIPIKN